MRTVALWLPFFVAVSGAAAAQTSPFVGHWDGTQHCESGDRTIALDIAQTPDGALAPTMKAGGIGTIDDGRIAGDTITMNWSNFISHATFTGKFVSLARVEGTYHESITGEDCTWDATNASPQSQAMAKMMAPVASAPGADTPSPVASSSASPSTAVPSPAPAPVREASVNTAATPHVPTELDRWKAEADSDRAKLRAHQSEAAKAQAVAQFCAYAPDQAACATRIGAAYEFLMRNGFATLTLASRNKAVPLPEMQPAAGLPSYYDVYQVFAFLTRAERH